MVISVVGDESSDETHERVFAISAVVGNDEEWGAAESAWLEATRGEEFHAAAWEHAKRFDDYKAATIALASSPVAGIIMTMDLQAFRAAVPDQLPDAGYYACFMKVISGISREWRLWNERVIADPSSGDPLVSRVEFTFDDRKESASNAGHLYSAFLRQPDWKTERLLGANVAFDSRKNPRIQMADLVAREGMKELDRKVGSKQYAERRSKVALEARGHFRFIEFHRDYFDRLASFTANLETAEGFGRQYGQWLLDTGRVQNGHVHDTWANRATFFSLSEQPKSGD
jgi:hypothetical protein